MDYETEMPEIDPAIFDDGGWMWVILFLMLCGCPIREQPEENRPDCMVTNQSNQSAS